MRRMQISKFIFAASILAAGAATAQETTNTWIVSDGATLDSDIDFSGTTPAQTTAETTGTFLATATLSSVIYYSVDDNTVDCGTLNSISTACTATTPAPEAQITVKANVPYAITVEDSGAPGTYDQVTLTHLVNLTDQFVIPLAVTSDASITQVGDDWVNDETNAEVVTLTPGTLGGLDFTDDSGAYEGFFTIVIAAQ